MRVGLHPGFFRHPAIDRVKQRGKIGSTGKGLPELVLQAHVGALGDKQHSLPGRRWISGFQHHDPPLTIGARGQPTEVPSLAPETEEPKIRTLEHQGTGRRGFWHSVSKAAAEC
jgi:hypothetical protein